MTSIQSYRSKLPFKRAVFLAAPLCLLLAAAMFGQSNRQGEVQFEKCWEYRSDTAGTKLVADRSTAYLVRGESIIDAISLESGKLLWSTDVGGSVESNLVLSGGNVILVRRTIAADKTPSTLTLRAISAATGVSKWNLSLPDGVSYSLFQFADKAMAVSEDGSIQFFSPSDGVAGSLIKVASGVKTIRGPLRERAIFVTDEKEVRNISSAAGEIAFVARSPYDISSVGVAGENSLVWGDVRGNLTSFGLESGKMEWQFKSGARITEIVRVNGVFLAASDDDFVYAISPGSGNRVWKKRLSGRVQALTPVGDNAVLVQTVGDHSVILLDAKTGKTAAQIAFGENENPIAAVSSDGKSAVILTDESLYQFSYDGCAIRNKTARVKNAGR